MGKKKGKNAATWAEAKTKCRLNAEDVEIAKQLGLSPRTLIANNSSTRQELWKAPTREWVRDMYEKRFGKTLSKPSEKQTLLEHPSPEFDEYEVYDGDWPEMPTYFPVNPMRIDKVLNDPFAVD